MKEDIAKQLMRLMHGELDEQEAAEVDRLVATDPEWSRVARCLEEAWDGVSDPPQAEVPAGFAEQVVRAATNDKPGWFPSWTEAPRSARWAAVAATATGIAVGSLLAPSRPPVAPQPEVSAVAPTLKSPRPERPLVEPSHSPPIVAEEAELEPVFGGSTLADSYWELLFSGEEAREGGAG